MSDPIVMSQRLTQSLLASDADMPHVHKRVVQIGAAAAWLVAAFFLVVGFLTDSSALYVESLGPMMAAGLMTAQVVLNKENGGIALLGAAIVTVVMYAVVGNEDTLIPAAVALVIICSIGSLFMNQRITTILVGGFVLVGVAPLLWGQPVAEALILGLIMALSYVMTAAIFLTVRRGALTLNAKFQTLFEHSPTAVMEEDWSEALRYIQSEYTGRPDRIEAFLLAYPAVVRRAVSLAVITRVNQAAIDLLEADRPADLLGPRDGNHVTDESLEVFTGALVALYRDEPYFEQDVRALTLKGNPIWIQSKSVDLNRENPGSNVLVGLADITYMKERQHAMADLVKSKDEFIARVSHELRTPLTAVIGLTSEMSSMESLGDEERVELMDLVANQASEMSYIVDDLLVAAKAEMGTVAIDSTVVDLGGELQAVIEGLGVSIAVESREIPAVVADASRVRQIIRNLLTNAERYGGANRRILTGARSKTTWLEVRDDGKGVSEDDAGNIFEPYATAHAGVTGSIGLGLSVSRQLAELMGGSLTYSRDAAETVFRLELPLAGDPQPVMAFNGTRF